MSFRCLRRLGALLLVLLSAACRKPARAPLEHSFYYWKTGAFQLEAAEDSLLRRLAVGHLYLHFMDVDWSENLKMPVPRFKASGLQYRVRDAYTPVVFVSNRVFERISEAWCDTLARRLESRLRLFGQRTDDYAISEKTYAAVGDGVYSGDPRYDSVRNIFTGLQKTAWREVQIDCDWTPATSARYFLFLRKFKALFGDKEVSVTVRLYPYKYPSKMGVPPVDRGLLMCYNMDNIRRPATENSVFDPKTMRSYLGGKKYPLPLDAALPIFSWTAVFRGNDYKGILREADSALLSDPAVFRPLAANRYRLLRDTVLEAMYLREGDVLRPERPDAEALREATAVLRDELPGLRRLSFYHWNYPDVLLYENTIAESWRLP